MRRRKFRRREVADEKISYVRYIASVAETATAPPPPPSTTDDDNSNNNRSDREDRDGEEDDEDDDDDEEREDSENDDVRRLKQGDRTRRERAAREGVCQGIVS